MLLHFMKDDVKFEAYFKCPDAKNIFSHFHMQQQKRFTHVAEN